MDSKVIIELFRPYLRWKARAQPWGWRMTEFHSKKIVDASTESYKRRVDALRNLRVATGFVPPQYTMPGRKDRYTWTVVLGGRHQSNLTVAASQMRRGMIEP